jgi:hypothetical protein
VREASSFQYCWDWLDSPGRPSLRLSTCSRFLAAAATVFCLRLRPFFEFISARVGCESLQGEAGDILELPDQKAQDFFVLITLNRLFPEHARMVFGEMPVRT